MLSIKIRKTIGIFSIAAIIGTASGCKKLIDFRPVSSLTKEEFYRTEADANSSIVGVYDALQACVSKFWLWGEGRGDLLLSGDYVYLQLMDNTRDISKWREPYQLIARANSVIEQVPQIVKRDDNFTQAESDAIVGEARFLRALSYFYLVRSFKEVPLVLESPTSDQVNYFISKSNADAVLDQIEQDLEFADQHVPVEYIRAKDSRGRVTKGAVNALQADVFLWRRKYDKAEQATAKVLENKKLYSLVPTQDWFTIFSAKNTTESIFEVQFDYTLNETNSLRSLGFTVNRALINLFTNEQDKTRGEWRTYAGTGTMWKYRGFSDNSSVERPTNDPNFIIYRLPDVMLMRAEALVHLEDPALKKEGLTLINTLRRRALIMEFDENDLDFAALPLKAQMILIMNEKALELGTEGKRWFDLVRVATNENWPEFLVDNILASRTVGERSTIKPRIIDQRSWYLPIHTDELRANPSLVQNPYYPE